MIFVVAKAQIKPDCLEAYLAEVKAILPLVHGEEGCIHYEPCVNWDGEGSTVTMMETWASKAHLDAHLASAHMKEFIAKVAPLREGKSDLLLLVPAIP